MSTCLCEFFSTLWVNLMNQVRYSPGNTREASMEVILDNLSSRQAHLEVQDHRCVCEARRLHASGARALFRTKMLEHRRLQGQMLQLQRYRENVLAQIDALRNHEINQTFVSALKGATFLHSKVDRKDTEAALDDIHESMAQVKELSDMLGQPLNGMDAEDDELERELLELTDQREEVPDRPAAVVRREVLPRPVEPAVTERMLVIPMAGA